MRIAPGMHAHETRIGELMIDRVLTSDQLDAVVNAIAAAGQTPDTALAVTLLPVTAVVEYLVPPTFVTQTKVVRRKADVT